MMDQIELKPDTFYTIELNGEVEIEWLCRKGSCAESSSCIDETFCAAKRYARLKPELNSISEETCSTCGKIENWFCSNVFHHPNYPRNKNLSEEKEEKSEDIRVAELTSALKKIYNVLQDIQMSSGAKQTISNIIWTVLDKKVHP